MHAGAELGAHLVGVHALVVGHRAADAVGRKLTAEAIRRMALQEHAAAQALVDDGVHALAVLNDADVVHDLGDTDDVVHVQQLADFLGEELSAGVFHAGHGRHARRGKHVLAELGLFALASMKRTPSRPMTLPISCGSVQMVVVPHGRMARARFSGIIIVLSMCICVSM